MTISISLSPQVEARLKERASVEGKDPTTYASELVERAITQPSVDEVLAPFRKQAAESGMSNEELDGFFRLMLQKVRTEKKRERKIQGLMAPVRDDFSKSDMNDEELMNLGRRELDALRQERKAKTG